MRVGYGGVADEMTRVSATSACAWRRQHCAT